MIWFDTTTAVDDSLTGQLNLLEILTPLELGIGISSILVGARIEALPETPANFALPVILPERPLGPSGQVAGLAEELNDLPRPSPRPLEAANG